MKIINYLMFTLSFLSLSANADHLRDDGMGGFYTDEGHIRSDGMGGYYLPNGDHQRSDGMGGYYTD